MIPTEFAPRKLRRKLTDDGLVETTRAAGDLLTRKHLGRPVLDPLVDRDIIRTVPRAELQRDATAVVEISEEESPVPFAALVQEGRVFSKTGLVLTDSFEVIEESAAEPEQAQQAMMAMLSRELFYGVFPLRGLLFGTHEERPESPSISVDGPVAPLIPRYEKNYYHWMVETVPKIRYLRIFEAVKEPVTLLIPTNTPSFVEETLALLGWPESRITRAEQGSHRFSELVISSFPDGRASDFRWLREEILKNAPNRLPESGTNVYVSRKNAVERRVVNEDEVMDVLSEFGFERYQLEERSLAENARLFADADIIVGPHGAGLTDVIFSGDGTLIELFGEKTKQPYKLLTKEVGVEYEMMYCAPDSTDIVVDTEKLREQVTTVLKHT